MADFPDLEEAAQVCLGRAYPKSERERMPFREHKESTRGSSRNKVLKQKQD
jgi:hypothetical protein